MNFAPYIPMAKARGFTALLIRSEIEKVLRSTEKLKVLLLRCEPIVVGVHRIQQVLVKLVVLFRNLTSLVFSLP